MKTQYTTERWMKHLSVLLFGVLILLGVLSTNVGSVKAQTSVNGLLYAPNVYYQEYIYDGDGMEFAAQDVKLQYAPDENGVYQFSVANAGTTIVFVYQVTDAGVIELAYFPETYESVDLRYHEDATDDLTALVLPAELTVGEVFYRGFQGDEGYHVVEILPKFDLLGIRYEEVVVVEPVTQSEDGEQRFYYAPRIGHIMDEWIFTGEVDEEAHPITTNLNYLRGPMNISFE